MRETGWDCLLGSSRGTWGLPDGECKGLDIHGKDEAVGPRNWKLFKWWRACEASGYRWKRLDKGDKIVKM